MNSEAIVCASDQIIFVYMRQVLRHKYTFPYTFYGVLRPGCKCCGLSAYIYCVTSTHFRINFTVCCVLDVNAMAYQCMYVASIASQVHISV